MEQDQEFLEYVVKAIVNNPNDVKATRTVDERGVLLTLDINPGDMGYVIGRQGQTARALRTLLKIVGAKNNARVNLKVNEPPGGRPPRLGGSMMGSSMGGGMNSMHSSAPTPAPINMDDVDTSAVDGIEL